MPTGSYVVEKPSYEEEAAPKKTTPRTSPIEFDWSTVIDETPKRVTTEDIRSPWDSTGVDDETVNTTRAMDNASGRRRYSDDDLFAELEKPATSPSRTMSFMDMLKAEREDKLRKAEEVARDVTENKDTESDYSLFDDFQNNYAGGILKADERDITRGYTDLSEDLTAMARSEEPDEANDDENLDEYMRLRREARSEKAAKAEKPMQFVAPAEEEMQEIQKDYERKTQSLGDELAAILGAGSSLPKVEEEPDLFDDEGDFNDDVDDVDTDAFDDMVDMYSSQDRGTGYTDLSRDDENEFNFDDDDDFELSDEDVDLAYEDDYVVSESAEEPVADELDEKESEIEMLKRRLAELMGEDTEEPVEVPKKKDDEFEEFGYDDIFSADLDNLDDEEDDEIAEAASVDEVVPFEEVAPFDEKEETEAEEETFGYEDAITADAANAAEPAEEIFEDSTVEAFDIEAELAKLGFVDAPAAEPEVAVEAEPAVEDAIVDVADAVEEEPVAEVAEVSEVEPVVVDAEEVNVADEAFAEAPAASEEEGPFVGIEESVKFEEPEEDPIGDAASASAEASEAAEVELVAEKEAGRDAVKDFEEPEMEDVSEETDAMSIEELERDLFGDDANLDGEAEATRKIDKFYTLYKKNEEFQKLLDEEYKKIQGVDSSDDLDSFFGLDGANAAEEPADTEPEMPSEEDLARERALEAQRRALEEARNQAVVEPDAPVESVAVEEADDDRTEEKLSKKELKAKKKAEKKAAKNAEGFDVDDEEESGGKALTIIAVVIAVLLVILLALILIMNFAPDSALGYKVTTVFENLTSYFSVVDVPDEGLML